jgi:hypothetical protein
MSTPLLRVERGQFLFDLEGTEGDRYHSRAPHWPGGNSGVTIGRGYDLGGPPRRPNESQLVYEERNRTFVDQVVDDFRRANIPDDRIQLYRRAVGLRGNAARDFVRERLPEISLEEQHALFNITYPRYETLVRNRIGSPVFEALRTEQRDALTSMAYNSPALIGVRLVGFLQTQDWQNVINEIRHHSNRTNHPGLQRRREREADLFSLGLSLLAAATPLDTLARNLHISPDDARGIIDSYVQRSGGELDAVAARLNSLLNPLRPSSNQTTEQATDQTTDQITKPPIVQWANAVLEAAPLLQTISTACGAPPIVSKVIQITSLVAQGIVAGAAIVATGASIGSCVGPIGTVVGCVVGIIAALVGSNNGPDSTQLILGQLSKLSEQLDHVRAIMQQEFRLVNQIQMRMLTITCAGFDALNQELRQQVASSRADTDARLEQINELMRGMLLLAHGNFQAASLIEFDDFCAATDQWLAGTYAGRPEEKIPDLSNALARWIGTHSSNVLFTGYTIYEQTPATVAAFLLPQRRDDRGLPPDTAYTVNMIAYLARVYRYYGGLANEINAEQLPNPKIWYRGVEQYTRLKQDERFLKYDNDTDDSQLKKVREAGERLQHFIESVDNDSLFWERILGRYDELLQNVKLTGTTYAAKANADRAAHLARAFATRGPIAGQAALAENTLNFFLPTKNAIDLFDNRGLGNLAGNVFNGNLAAGFGGIPGAPQDLAPLAALTNLTPWCRAGLVRPHYLCAEYLGLLSFSASIRANIDIPPVGPSFNNNFIVNFMDTLRARGVGGDDKTHVVRAGREFFNDLRQHWQIPARLEIRGAGINVDLTCDFQGSYDGLLVDGCHLGIRPYRFDPNADDGNACHNRLRAGIPRFLHGQWQGANHALPVINVSHIPSAPARAQIDNYFLTFRRSVAEALRSGQNEHNQDLLNHFNNALSALDFHVRVIKLFIHLVGRDTLDPTIGKLVDSEKIRRGLTEFQQQGIDTVDLFPLVTPRHITANDIPNVSFFDPNHDPFHPLSLYQRGIAKLEKYESQKKIFSLEQEMQRLSLQDITALEAEIRGIENLIATRLRKNQPVEFLQEDLSGLLAQKEEHMVAKEWVRLHTSTDKSAIQSAKAAKLAVPGKPAIQPVKAASAKLAVTHAMVTPPPGEVTDVAKDPKRQSSFFFPASPPVPSVAQSIFNLGEKINATFDKILPVDSQRRSKITLLLSAFFESYREGMAELDAVCLAYNNFKHPHKLELDKHKFKSQYASKFIELLNELRRSPSEETGEAAARSFPLG